MPRTLNQGTLLKNYENIPPGSPIEAIESTNGPAKGPNASGQLPILPAADPLDLPDEIPLNANDKFRLDQFEHLITRALKSFVLVGGALLTIRDERLYRQTHRTFEQYCLQKWGLGRAHAYRYVESARVCRILSPIGDKSPRPTNEAQARELIALSEEDIVSAWTEVVQKAEGKSITAKMVRQAAAKFKRRQVPHQKSIELKPGKLFTLGIEDRTSQEIISLLKRRNILTLVDVRLQPERGRQAKITASLKKELNNFEINYLHIQELGNLFSPIKDWKSRYQRLLAQAGDVLVERLLITPEPFCLLGTEKDPSQCHRSSVAAFMNGRGWETEHIISD